jgi:hypothetical protein
MTIITGLPRTRTAWVSAWLDVEHEPLRCRILDWNLVRTYGDQSGVIVDSGAIMFHQKLNELWPNAYWVFILRPPEEVKQSFINIMPDLRDDAENIINQLVVNLDASIKAAGNHKLLVKFNEMDSPAIMSHVWDVAINQPFDIERLKRYGKLHIEAKEFSKKFIINH